MSVAEAQVATSARARRFTIPVPVLIAAIPFGFLLVGLLIRYWAYANAVGDASISDFPMGLCRWDCAWYIRIAEQGYDPFPVPSHVAAGNWAFFPLMPLFVGAIRWLLHAPTMSIATVVSLGLSWATAVIAWPLFDRNWRAYTLFSAYLLAGPFSIYFTTFMTEPMFIFLTTATLVALRRGNYIAAGIAAGLTSATRIVGVFLSLAILVQAIVDHRRSGGTWKNLVPAVLRRPDVLLGLVLAPLGAFAYMLFLSSWIGDGLAFMHVQRAWSRPEGDPLVFVWQALNQFPKTGWWPTSSQELGVATLVGFALIAILAWRRQWPEATFSVVALATPLFAGMASMLRFISATAPLPILLCQLLGRYRAVFALALLGFLIADYWTATGWIKGELALV